MKFPHRALIGMLLGCCWLATPAGAQTPGLPAFIIAADRVTDAQKKTIRDFISQQVQNLQGQDPAVQSRAREELARPAENPQATIFFRDAYADLINEALLPLADNEDLRVRLNAAIVVARVAERAQNVRLKDATHAFLTDEAAPVALWGMRAARHVLPHIVGNRLMAEDPILSAVVPVACEHRLGHLVAEAYDTLRIGMTAGARNAPPQANIVKVVPPMLELLEFRIQQHQTGQADTPLAENTAMQFLIDSRVWPSLSKEQKLKAAQFMVDLLALTAQRAVKNAGPVLDRDLMYLFRYTATNVALLAEERLKNKALAAAAHQARQVGVNNKPQELIQFADAVLGAFKGVEGFENLRPPPRLGAAQPAPAAATQSAVPPNQVASEVE